MNHFQRSAEYPFHISIGGIVVNAEGKICCHHFNTISIPGIGKLDDFYLLMRETIEPGESIETCLARGLMEEFGVTATIRHFVGSIVSTFPLTKDGPIVEKTTLYFLCDLTSFDISKRKKNDPESGSTIHWLSPQELMAKMKEQGIRLGREDADESSAVEKVVKFVNSPGIVR